MASAKLFEALGARGLYLFFTQLTGERRLPPSRQGVASGWTGEDLESLRADSQYYAKANLVKAVHYAPPFVALWLLGGGWATWLCGALTLLHLCAIVADRYRGALASALTADPDAEQVEKAPTPPQKPHWWFTPKSWETPKLYRALHFEWVRQRTINYIKKTRPGANASSQTHGLDEGANAFEASTRVGETLHLIACGLNVPILVAFVQLHAWFWVLWAAWLVYMDFCLGILQRYHRVRLHTAMNRRTRPRRRVEAAS